MRNKYIPRHDFIQVVLLKKPKNFLTSSSCGLEKEFENNVKV